MEENTQNLNTTPTPVEPTIEPEKKKLLKSKWIVLGAIIFVLILISTGVAYFFLNSNKQVACTTEAKLCPDGSYVERTGPKCDFAKCPQTTPTPDPTADWQTFSSVNYEFSFKYPKEYYIISESNNTVSLGRINVKDKIKKDYTYITISNKLTFSPLSYRSCSNEIEYPNGCISDPEEIIVGDVKANLYVLDKGYDGSSDIIQLNNPVLEITWTNHSGGSWKEIFFSTFKFTQ